MDAGPERQQDGTFAVTSVDLELRPGERWVIFARDEGGSLASDACTGSRLLRADEEPRVGGGDDSTVVVDPVDEEVASSGRGSITWAAVAGGAVLAGAAIVGMWLRRRNPT